MSDQLRTVDLPLAGQVWRPTRFVEGQGTRQVIRVDEYEVVYAVLQENGERWATRHRHWHEWVRDHEAMRA